MVDEGNVPGWFKLISDGCSVPLGRIGGYLLRADKMQDSCIKHDFRYYLVALQWRGPTEAGPPSKEWVGGRMEADYELKRDRKRVARNRLIGWAYSRLWFRGVRIGGRAAMRLPSELAVPPTMAAIAEVEARCRFPVTEQAQVQISKWRHEVEVG